MGRLTALAPRIGALPPKLKAAPKLAESFYTSPQWRRVVGEIKRARGGCCERCGSRRRVIGDHKIERKDGGADFDPSNIELLCITCHNRKTAAARAARSDGRHGATGRVSVPPTSR